MSDSERRSILSQVAEGTLSPDEAAERLAVLDPEAHDRDHRHGHDSHGSRSGGTGNPAAAGGERGLPPGEPAHRLRIVGSVRMIEIIGDPSVMEAIADGPHDARREGNVLVIEGEGPDVVRGQPGWRWNWNWGGDEDGQEDDQESRRDWYVGYKGGQGWSSGRRRRPAVQWAGGRRNPALKVRVNPDLPLEVGVKAGAMSVKGVNSPITAECDAASLQIKGFSGPLEARVNAGKFEASGRLDSGDSRIEANAAKVDLRLDSGSSVKIRARSELGRVSLPGGENRSGSLLGSEHEAVIGAGAATLDMEVNVGAATVTVEGV